MSGLGERLAHLRAGTGISVRDLATVTGIPYSDLLRLENGGRRPLGAEALGRLAEYFLTTEGYLLLGREPSPAEVRAGFLRYHASLGEKRRAALKYQPIQSRVECMLHYLETAFPTVLDRSRMAGRLGHTARSLAEVLNGTAPLQSHLLNLLASTAGLGIDFFVRGDFFGGVAPAEGGLEPGLLCEYYEVVREAAGLGISAEALRRAVRIMAVRDGAG